MPSALRASPLPAPGRRSHCRIAGRWRHEKGLNLSEPWRSDLKKNSKVAKAPERLEPKAYPVEFAVCGYGGEHIRLPLEGRSEDGFYPVGMLCVRERGCM